MDTAMVGVDLERVKRFGFVHKSGGNAFYRRVYTLAEQQAYGRSPELLALCYAGKEAVSKVLGTGLTLNEPDGVSCQDIEILWNRAPDHPEARLRRKAQVAAQQLSLFKIVLYCQHIRALACAVAGGAATLQEAIQLEAALRASLGEIKAYLEKRAGARGLGGIGMEALD
jgi:phosphopantetheine--protein transferase-like protein